MTDTLKAIDDLGELLDELAGNAREFDFHGTNRMEQAAAKALLVIEAALTPPAAVEDGWQPIETAPRNEIIIDLWAEDGRFPECWWTGQRWISYLIGTEAKQSDEPWFQVRNPTHWKHLPPPPTTKETK